MNILSSTAPISALSGRRQFLRASGRELKIAAIAQAVGIIAFVGTALIHGLLASPPVPEVQSPAHHPMDYRLTPTDVLPGDKPDAMVRGDAETFNQIVAVMKAEIKMAQSPRYSSSAQVEFVSAKASNDHVLSLTEVLDRRPQDALGRAVDIHPMVSVTLDENTVGSVQSAMRAIMDKMKSTPVNPFVVVVRFLPHEDGSQARSFGLIKNGSRILFVDEDSRISEVFTSQ